MVIGNMKLWLLGQDATFWLPPAGATGADQHDAVFYPILYITTFFFLLVVTLMLVFIVKYRRSKGPPRPDAPTHSAPLEVAWTGIPLILVIVFFVLGFKGFLNIEQPPSDATIVKVTAKQWSFSFKYPTGAESNNLYLEQGRPVRLIMHSLDVTHSLYVPAFRVQRNIVPGRETEEWFNPTVVGKFDVFCTQYCGDGHSQMGSGNPDPDQASYVYVLTSADYAKKMEELGDPFHDPVTKAPIPYVVVGARLYKQDGCAQCHSVDGSDGTGPTWLGLYKRDHTFSTTHVPGYTLLASDSDAKWDDYLNRSITDPGANVVAGRQNVMPQQPGLMGSPEADKKRAAIIEYIKSLDNHGPGGKPLYYRPRVETEPAATGPATPVSTPAGK